MALTMTDEERNALLATLGPRIAEFRAKAIPVVQSAVTRLGEDECGAIVDALAHHGFVSAGPTADRARCALEGVLRGLNMTPDGWSDIWALLDSARLERDATRERLAAAERDATFGAPVIVDAYKAELAAREAECVELREALEQNADGPEHERWCNGDGAIPCDCGGREDWEALPRVQRLKAVLSRPPGSTEALRAWGVRVARFYEEHRSEHTPEECVARLLEPATQAQGETPS